jgi:hypothetical protein
MKSNGKNICHALKTIRKQVAEANGIDYTPAPCHFDGDCSGTCPACEAEVQYIESQLGRLRLAGKAVKVAGLALGLTMVAGCNSSSGTPPSAADKPTAANETSPTSQPCPQPHANAPISATDEGAKPHAKHHYVRGNNGRVVKKGAAQADTTAIYMADSSGFALPEVSVTSTPAKKIACYAGGIPYYQRIARNRNHVYLNPEISPRYKKGDVAMRQFIENNIRLTPTMSAACGQFLVKVACVVERNGRLSAMRVIQSVDSLYDAEAIRVLKKMPRWRPARMEGKRVRSLVVIGVPFVLK